MKKIFSLLIVFSLFGCKNNIAFDKTEVREGIVYTKDQKNPFTGIVYEEFDNGIKPAEHSYVEGVLFGEWKTYDHTGDIVQEGQYFEDKRIIEFVSNTLDIRKRDVSICIFKEGDFHFLDIHIYAKGIKESSAFALAKEIKSSLLDSYQVDEKTIIFKSDDNSSFVF